MQQNPDNQQPQPQYPYAQSQTPPPPPMQPYGAPQPPTKKKRRKWSWIVGIILALVVIGSINAAISGGNGIGNQLDSTPTADQSQATSAPADQSTSADQPTQPPAAQYPPKTLEDLQGLAAQGDASQIHEFHSESVGLTGVCPQPKKLVTVSSKLKGKQLAEDLLAYFFGNQLDSPCGSVVFAYHTQAESQSDNGYTAGRVILNTDNPNSNPNATNIKYTVTVDTGDWLTAPDYVVTYTK